MLRAALSAVPCVCVRLRQDVLSVGGWWDDAVGAVRHDAEEGGALHIERSCSAYDASFVLGCVVGRMLTYGEELHGVGGVPDVGRWRCIGTSVGLLHGRG